MRRPLTVRVVLLALPLLVLCASPALALVGAQAEIRLTERGFAPQAVDVAIGEDVVWVNRSRAEQTLVGEDGSFDSGPLRPGDTFTISLRESGTVRYATADGGLEGEIRVVAVPPAEEAPDDAGATPTPTPSPEGLDAVAADVAIHTEDTLPNTGSATVLTLGAGLLLICVGTAVLRRFRDDA